MSSFIIERHKKEMSMNHWIAKPLYVFENKVWYDFGKITIGKKLLKFVSNHLIIISDSINPGVVGSKSVISTYAQAEEAIIKWYYSGSWIKTWNNDEDRNKWLQYIDDKSYYEGIEIKKMETTWYIFLQDPRDFQEKPYVWWIQVNAKSKAWQEGIKRPFVREERFLVAIESKVKNEKGLYILTDDMKEQALSMVRDYYEVSKESAWGLKIEVEMSVDKKYIDHVVCPDGIVPGVY